jgi:hypothetical protein
MSAYILTVTDEDSDILFQQAGDSEDELKAAAIEWMHDSWPELFDEDGRLQHSRSNSVEDNYKTMVELGDDAPGAPRPIIRKAGKK